VGSKASVWSFSALFWGAGGITIIRQQTRSPAPAHPTVQLPAKPSAQVRLCYSHLLCCALAKTDGTTEWKMRLRSHQQKHDENIATDLICLSATTTWAEVMLDDGYLSKEGRAECEWSQLHCRLQGKLSQWIRYTSIWELDLGNLLPPVLCI